MLTREQLRIKLEPIVKEHHTNHDKLSAALLPIAKEHYGEDMVGIRNLPEFDEMCELWNGVMADIVEEFNLRRH